MRGNCKNPGEVKYMSISYSEKGGIIVFCNYLVIKQIGIANMDIQDKMNFDVILHILHIHVQN
jgi:hypothetical protein